MADDVWHDLGPVEQFAARSLTQVTAGRTKLAVSCVGGAFGVKNNVYREYAIPALLALRLRRPVKWIATRGDEFVTMQQGRDMRIDVSLAVQPDGTFSGLKVRNVANLGAYLQPASVGPPGRPLPPSPGCSRIATV